MARTPTCLGCLNSHSKLLFERCCLKRSPTENNLCCGLLVWSGDRSSGWTIRDKGKIQGWSNKEKAQTFKDRHFGKRKNFSTLERNFSSFQCNCKEPKRGETQTLNSDKNCINHFALVANWWKCMFHQKIGFQGEFNDNMKLSSFSLLTTYGKEELKSRAKEL